MTTSPTALASSKLTRSDEVERFLVAAGLDSAYRRVRANVREEDHLIASGSLVEGFGNSRSDVDLYLVRRIGSSRTPTQMSLAKHRYLDVEGVSVEALSERLARLSRDTSDPATLAATRLKELDQLYRIGIGVLMMGRSSDHPGLLVPVDAVRRCVAAWSALRAWAAVARSTLAAERNLLAAERENARLAAHLAIMSRLAEVGEGYPSLKWTAEKLHRWQQRSGIRHEDWMHALVGTLDAVALLTLARDALHAGHSTRLLRLNSPLMRFLPSHVVPLGTPERPFLAVSGRRVHELVPPDDAAVAALITTPQVSAPLGALGGTSETESAALLHVVAANVARHAPAEAWC